jgi:type IV pilus assembly protein PilB
MRLEEEMDSGSIEPGEAYSAIAQVLGVPYVNLDKARLDTAAISLVPEDTCRKYTVFPVRLDRATNVLWVAMSDVSTPHAADELQLVSHCTIRAALADPEQISAAIDRSYSQG